MQVSEGNITTEVTGSQISFGSNYSETFSDLFVSRGLNIGWYNF